MRSVNSGNAFKLAVAVAPKADNFRKSLLVRLAAIALLERESARKQESHHPNIIAVLSNFRASQSGGHAKEPVLSHQRFSREAT